MVKRAIIMGAAGRDFHNFNTVFRGRHEWRVVAFTAAQIPFIEKRRYPPALAGRLYPRGIPIRPEEELKALIRAHRVDEVFFSYSDVSHQYVMDKASDVLAAGANFTLLGPRQTQLRSRKRVISVCAVRTGCGKSQTTRKIAEYLRRRGVRFAVVRHPMPYGRLSDEVLERFANRADLDRYKCTIEEREEYEPYIAEGIPVYAGVDYLKILRAAEREADVILWDGGNNDFPFFRSDLHIVVADPLRAGHELTYYPGAVNFRQADILVINKINSARAGQIRTILANAKAKNPDATVVLANSVVRADKPALIRNRRVLVIEDGPTVTHGGMAFGAGLVAARKYGAKAVVDPRRFAVGPIREAFMKYPHLSRIVPALGYAPAQLRALEQTIARTPCDTVIVGTPIDLARLITIRQPIVRVSYDLEEKRGDVLAHVRRLLQ